MSCLLHDCIDFLDLGFWIWFFDIVFDIVLDR